MGRAHRRRFREAFGSTAPSALRRQEHALMHDRERCGMDEAARCRRLARVRRLAAFGQR